MAPEAMDFFMTYRWSGTVRELRDALEYAFVVAESGRILVKHLPARMVSPLGTRHEISTPVVPLNEKEALIDALVKSRGNQSQAAGMRGVNRVTIWHRVKKYGIDPRNPLASRSSGQNGGLSN